MNIIKLFFFIHIIFMTLGLAFMMRAIIDINRKKKDVFSHKIDGKLGAIFAIIGLISAGTFVEMSSGLHLKTPHSLSGIITLVLIVLSVILAIMGTKGHKFAYKLHRPISAIAFTLYMLTFFFGILLAVSS